MLMSKCELMCGYPVIVFGWIKADVKRIKYAMPAALHAIDDRIDAEAALRILLSGRN